MSIGDERRANEARERGRANEDIHNPAQNPSPARSAASTEQVRN